MIRYVYIKDSFIFPPNYKFKWFVYAIDLKEKCGFCPQDHDYTWEPNEEYCEVTIDQFKEYCKSIKIDLYKF